MSASAKPDLPPPQMQTPSQPILIVSGGTKRANSAEKHEGERPKKIWIDLENSPHVPFFKPIIEELKRRGYSVVLTARDCFQVCDLADLFQLQYRRVGHHYGKHKLAKLGGLVIRALQMSQYVLREKPDLAVSHGSRSLFLLSSVLRIPTVTILDYEHVRWVPFLQPSWVMTPEVIPDEAVSAWVGIKKERILKYPGIKEDVYAPSFRPDPSIKHRLGLNGDDLVVTIRPPATEAHYHNPESEKLLYAVFEIIGQEPDAKAVLLPRTPKQEAELCKQWPDLFRTGKIIVPEHVVKGLDLIWFSDLVISGGGTMNREAAALGVPVYSIFRGKMGAVDKCLAETGRLVLLESEEDVRTKLRLVRRNITGQAETLGGPRPTLQVIVDHIATIVDHDDAKSPVAISGTQGHGLSD